METEMLVKELLRAPFFALLAALVLLLSGCVEEEPAAADDSGLQETAQEATKIGAGDLSDRLRCKPGDTRQVDCNSCTCTERGRWVCTELSCPVDPVAPCEGKVCGDACNTPCPPGMACPAVMKFCNQDGECTMRAPVCEGDPQPEPTNPCEGKVCGDACNTPCPPGMACPAVMKFCNQDGECTMRAPVCEGDPKPEPTSPCEGKVCGEACSTCTGTVCPAVMEYCDMDGKCSMSLPLCSGEAPEPEPEPIGPCHGKVCGEVCSTCTPGPGIYCPAVMEYCNQDGRCSMSAPVCAEAI